MTFITSHQNEGNLETETKVADLREHLHPGTSIVNLRELYMCQHADVSRVSHSACRFKSTQPICMLTNQVESATLHEVC